MAAVVRPPHTQERDRLFYDVGYVGFGRRDRLFYDVTYVRYFSAIALFL